MARDGRFSNDYGEYYNNQYYYSKIFAEMVEKTKHNLVNRLIILKGYVGVPIELEELSEEGRQKLIDKKIPEMISR